MLATDCERPLPMRRQRGAYTVEFAIAVPVFLVFLFGVMELARAMYLINTLQEVTRRAATAAARSNPRDSARRQQIREMAVLRSSPGMLPLGTPIKDEHVRIEYYALVVDSSGRTSRQLIPYESLSCPVNNRRTCMLNPNDPLCVRFVRARICDPDSGDACDTKRVTYSTIMSVIGIPIGLPHSSTIVPADSLGYTPGMVPCP